MFPSTWSMRAYMVGTLNSAVGRSRSISAKTRAGSGCSGMSTDAAPTRAGK